jgi:replicative DNA helicase
MEHICPKAIEAEQMVIGILLYDNMTYENIDTLLKKDHFYDPLHMEIFDVITCCIQQGKVASPITVWPYFITNESIKERGGREYIAQLAKNLISVSYIKDYAEQVIDAYTRRELIRIAQDMIFNAEQSTKIDIRTNQYIEDAENRLFMLIQKSEAQSSMIKFRNTSLRVIDAAKTALQSDKKIIGIPTGFCDLDKHIGGLHKSDLITIAGRPSMGKTAFAINIAFNAAVYAAAHSEPGVVFFSLEMSSDQLAMRILGQETGISPDKIRRGMISAKDLERLQSQAQHLANIPLYIDDTPGMSISGLRTRLRRLMRKDKVGLVVIDYMQLLTSNSNSENRVQELSTITRSLKNIAKEFDLPVIALSQLSRAVEQRDDKRPQLADLRESGTIEQDSDIVMFIFRESYYEARKKPPEGSNKMAAWQENMNKIHDIAEIMIAKQRHGPIKNITLHYQDSLAKFGNYMHTPDFVQG